MVNHRNINQTREKIVNLKAAACHREVHVLCAVAGVGSLVRLNQRTIRQKSKAFLPSNKYVF